jgi:hypothetical protein
VAGDHEGNEVDATGALPPFPFVVGCHRSGLTLLRAMCESHPDVAIAPESRWLLTARPARVEAFTPARFVEQIYADDQFRRWGVSRAAVELSFHATPPRTYVDAVRHVYTLWAAQRGRGRYGDKTADHVLGLDIITTLFPEARVVHVVRDGRDVAASFLELGWSDTIEHAALHWRQRVLQGRHARDLLGPVRYHEVRYEDLVMEPERTLRQVCQAIALPFHPAMLHHQRVAAAVTRSEPPANRNRYLGRPVMPRLRDWRRDLPSAAVDRFEVVAADALVEMGYELRTSPAQNKALGTRLAARRQWLSWHSQRFKPSRRRRGYDPGGSKSR